MWWTHPAKDEITNTITQVGSTSETIVRDTMHIKPRDSAVVTAKHGSLF